MSRVVTAGRALWAAWLTAAVPLCVAYAALDAVTAQYGLAACWTAAGIGAALWARHIWHRHLRPTASRWGP